MSITPMDPERMLVASVGFLCSVGIGVEAWFRISTTSAAPTRPP